ncbi:hypothetical protein JCM19237_3357 [Photobacterium aphoticum]|uniref:Uncharacterized protein n=1 Tax=Photobacterium aphoticum TaxID=754436 RepID=A0A090QYR0_9GAMM|nr:hypothetical protein JCM19237_3357 [Photobacterium aphoticum]
MCLAVKAQPSLTLSSRDEMHDGITPSSGNALPALNPVCCVKTDG